MRILGARRPGRAAELRLVQFVSAGQRLWQERAAVAIRHLLQGVVTHLSNDCSEGTGENRGMRVGTRDSAKGRPTHEGAWHLTWSAQL